MKSKGQKELPAPSQHCLPPGPHLTSCFPHSQGQPTWTSAQRARMTATSMPSARTHPSPTNASASRATKGKAGSVKVSPAQPSWPDPVAAMAAICGRCPPRGMPAAQALLGLGREARGLLGICADSRRKEFGVMGYLTHPGIETFVLF